MAYGNHANCKHLEKVYEPDRNNTTQRQRLVNNAILLESSTTADFSVFFLFLFFSVLKRCIVYATSPSTFPRAISISTSLKTVIKM